MDIPIKRFDKNFALPAPEPGAACFDMICRETVAVPAHGIKPIRQNFALQVPAGHALLIFSRSSTPLRKGLMLANSVGVLDPFYSGDQDEVMAFMFNLTNELVTVEAGDKIVQGMIIRTEPVAWQEADHLGTDGHGGYQHLDELEQRENKQQ